MKTKHLAVSKWHRETLCIAQGRGIGSGPDRGCHSRDPPPNRTKPPSRRTTRVPRPLVLLQLHPNKHIGISRTVAKSIAQPKTLLPSHARIKNLFLLSMNEQSRKRKKEEEKGGDNHEHRRRRRSHGSIVKAKGRGR